jgi:hypothetical protein
VINPNWSKGFAYMMAGMGADAVFGTGGLASAAAFFYGLFTPMSAKEADAAAATAKTSGAEAAKFDWKTIGKTLFDPQPGEPTNVFARVLGKFDLRNAAPAALAGAIALKRFGNFSRYGSPIYLQRGGNIVNRLAALSPRLFNGRGLGALLRGAPTGLSTGPMKYWTMRWMMQHGLSPAAAVGTFL